MKNKLIAILFGALFLALAFVANVNAQSCDNDLYSLTYSPSDLVSRQAFNVTLTDVWGLIIGQPAWLDYSTLTILSSNPQYIQDIGGDYQARWLLNSSSAFSGNITATVFNGTNNCTITKPINITDSGLVGTPNLIVNPTDWGLINASKTPMTYGLDYSNSGTGNAFNVSTLFTLPGFSSQSNPITVASGATTSTNAGIITSALCGTQNLSMHTSYQNILGSWFGVNNYDSFNVSGSDLTVTNVYLERTSYYDGQTVNSIVTVRNWNRTANGGFPAEAIGVIIRFDGVQCNGPSNVGIGETENFTCGYHLNEEVTSTQTITYTIRVDATNDCLNWNGSLKSYPIQLTVRPTSSGGGSGGGGSGGSGSGGGATYVAVCGNKICEPDENPVICPTDCGQTTSPTITQTGQGEDYLIVYSDDGMASVFAASGTKIFMDKMPIINPKSWIMIKPSTIATTLPYGITMVRQYEFIPNGLEFMPQATVSIKYNNNELKSGAYLMYYDTENSKWIFVDSIVDKNNNLISTKVSHFSTYALVTKPGVPLTGLAIIDSSLIFLKENLLVNMLIVLGIILILAASIVIAKSRKKK